MTHPEQESLAEKETGRVEAFGDGVFAIAITLLVLELKVPRDLGAAALAARLADEWPSYLAFLTSLATIGIMWLNHHRLFTLIRRVDHTLLALNALLLLGVSVVPFPTALVAGYLGHEGETLAVVVYCATSIAIAVFFHVLWRYAAPPAREPRLLRVAPDSPEVRADPRPVPLRPAVVRPGAAAGTVARARRHPAVRGAGLVLRGAAAPAAGAEDRDVEGPTWIGRAGAG